MTINLPRWFWILLGVLAICIVIWLGNVLHFWTFHFSFGV